MKPETTRNGGSVATHRNGQETTQRQEMSDNSRAVAERMATAVPQPEFEEVVEAVPSLIVFTERDLADLRALAEKISHLGNGHALLRRKRMTTSEIAAIRHQLEARGFKLITRTQPGQTYFWRGDPIEPKYSHPKGVIGTKLDPGKKNWEGRKK